MGNTPTFYNDLKFLAHPSTRSLRILSEYIGPEQRLKQFNINHTIVFFGSARIASPNTLKKSKGRNRFLSAKKAKEAISYYEKARQLAKEITYWTLKIPPKLRPYLVTGGGSGIMEAGNRGVKEAGGTSLGMSISLPNEHSINNYCAPKISMQFHYFFMQKFWLFFKTRAFIAFPGGIGTLDELFEILTLIQTKKVSQFPIILFGSEFWKSLINFEQLLDWGLINPEDLDLFKMFDDVNEASQYLKSILTPEYLANSYNC